MTIKKRFINRNDEVAYLAKEYKEGSFKFISIIGRRRVGKTRLIEEFIKIKKDAVYFFVQEQGDIEIRQSLAQRLHNELNLSFLGIPSWENIFEELFKASEKSRIILVLDEFQRFLNINKAVPSILQGMIDKYGKKSKLFLVVMGSYIGMMQKLFDYSSALYGRRTGQLTISPLLPTYLREWFQGISQKEAIQAYSIFGGTPKYLEEIDQNQTIMNNIKEKILAKHSILYNEPEILIKTELSDSGTYFNILKLIAEGKTKPKQIADSLTIKPTSLSYFLNVLENNLELIKRETVVTEKKPNSKKAIYKIRDNFFRFWFKYVYPNRSDIEIENLKPLVKKIESELNIFIGHSFEDICKIFLIKSKKIPFIPTKVGTWWGFHRKDGIREEHEIDIVALDDNKEILYAECKWQSNVNARKIISDLKEKAKFVEWNNGRRKEYFAVFARSFKEKIKEPGVLLYDLKDLNDF